jgi:ring-1,2-phenylacetyl-CoA epoxidase subunit PaaC
MTNEQIFEYALRIGDNALIYGQRLSEWCGHGPVLEEDIALTNTALDYLGQATNMLKFAAEVEGKGRDEDKIAFLRDVPEYKNLLLVELPNGDYANTIARQFMFATWYYLYLRELANSKHEFFKAFAEKSIKEVKYHWQHSSDWVKRMGDGTPESHTRIQRSFNELWEFHGEMFLNDDLDNAAIAAGIGVDNAALKSEWSNIMYSIMNEATLTVPEDGWFHKGGRIGRHTEHLGYMLADMQFMQRTYPNSKW